MAIFPKLFLTVVILISSEILVSGFVILDGIVRPASIHASPKSQEDLKEELVHENARYLGEAYHGAFYGRMIHITDENNDDSGCQLPWFDNELPGHPWVALVRKGDCDLNTKVKHASKYHAAGIIIYDNATTGQLPRFNLLKNEVGGDEMNTKAVFTSKGKGEELVELTKNNTNVTVYVHPGTWRVEPLEDSRIDKLKTIFRLCLLYFQKADIPKHNGPESPRSSQNANTYLSYERNKNRNVVMVTLVVIIIVGVGLIGIIYYWKKNYFDETHDEISRNMIQATQCAMLRIPTKKLKSEDLSTEEKDIDCVICFETFKIHETIRIMPCNHKFHKCCIDPWLMGHKTCPMCKLNILQYYGFSFTGSQESILQIDPDGMDDYNDDNSSIRTIRFETFSDTSDESASPSPSENEAGTEENLEVNAETERPWLEMGILEEPLTH